MTVVDGDSAAAIAADVADDVTRENLARYPCWCADAPKPCSYHEGYWDGAEQAVLLALKRLRVV